jgi:hypothetical protein
MQQVDLGPDQSARRTRKRQSLDEMERVVPWARLIGLIEPHSPKRLVRLQSCRYRRLIFANDRWYRILTFSKNSATGSQPGWSGQLTRKSSLSGLSRARSADSFRCPAALLVEADVARRRARSDEHSRVDGGRFATPAGTKCGASECSLWDRGGAPRHGRKGRHFVVSQIGRSEGRDFIDVLRLLHDAMDLPRHLPPVDEAN